jgi:hypothetical protein
MKAATNTPTPSPHPHPQVATCELCNYVLLHYCILRAGQGLQISKKQFVKGQDCKPFSFVI